MFTNALTNYTKNGKQNHFEFVITDGIQIQKTKNIRQYYFFPY